MDKLANRLVESLQECKRTLQMVQQQIEGKEAVPWPQIDRAEGVLAAFRAARAEEKSLPMAEEIQEQSRGR